MTQRYSIPALVALVAALGFPAWAGAQQTGGIVGNVVDATTLAPVPGATVEIVGTNLGTLTNDDGRYLLRGVPIGSHTVRVGSIGYAAQEQAVEVTAGQTVTVDLALTTQAIELGGIVAVGYGTVRREDLTGSVSSIQSSAIDRLATVSLQQSLQGTVAGVNVTQGEGAPGGGMRVQIRGTNSMNSGSATPLYVIDGVPIASSGISKSQIGAVSEENLSSLTETNPMATLSPSEIESIDILKDASATAIYGSRGANGVVIITTKRGQNRFGGIELSASQGWATVPKTIDVLNAYDYATYVNQSYINIGDEDDARYGGANNRGSLTPDSLRALVGDGMDWQEEIFQTAPVQDIQLSFGGSDDNGTYRISGNYLDQTGIIRGSSFARGGLRVNVDRNLINENFRFSSHAAITRSVNDMVRSATINGYRMEGIVRTAQYYPPFTIPDSANPDPRAEDPDLPGIIGSNPLRYTDEVEENDQITRGLGGIRLITQLPADFSLDVSVGGNYEGRNYNQYFPRTVAEGAANNGVAVQARTEFSDLLSENLLRYETTLADDHRLNFVGGFTYNWRRSTYLSQEVNTFPDDILGSNVLQNGTNNRKPQSGLYNDRLASWLARMNYNLFDRYLLTATVRADGSSKFAENEKWAVFPAFAAAWNVRNEPFLADNDLLSTVKLRLSYGKSGNQAIGPYQSLAAVAGTGTTVVFGGNTVAAYALTQLPNPDLRWETTEQYNAGIDFGLWNNRLTATFDYYDKRTQDLLQQVQLPTNTGFSSAWFNSGEVSNKGVELQVGYDLLTGESLGGLTWSLSANASHNENEIVSLGALPSQFAGRLGAGGSLEVTPFIQKPGLPIGAMWGYQTDGLIRTVEDSVAYAEYFPSGTTHGRVGDYRLLDLNGDGEITEDDRGVVGDANPDWIWSVNSQWTMGAFDLSALVTAVQGNDIINTQRMDFLVLDGQGKNLPKEIVENAFHPEDNPDGIYPMIRNDRPGYGRFMDVFVEDGSYIRLKNVQLGYRFDLPGARAARVYVNGTNLLTSTDYDGYDPEVSAFGGVDRPGVDQGTYPNQRTITIGLTTSF